jgi:hypothetical protein
VSASWHRPGRGAGNSINSLLDAYALTKSRHYMTKAEALLQRCIHPADDVASLELSQPEFRWSYLVFLQTIAKYLDMKLELGEIDYHFHYARESLLAYARWMADHERPYIDWFDRVLIPTETWPAHDVRKSHVFNAAARYGPAEAQERFRERADFFFRRCIDDLLSFPTSGLTRPLVILSVYGHVHGYFQQSHANTPVRAWAHDHSFGAPVEFRTQRQRAAATMRSRMRVLRRELARLLRDRITMLRRRLTG